MGDMEDKLGAILNDPKMMQQIMSMAQALGQTQNPPIPEAPPPKPEPGPPPMPELDFAMLQKLSGLARQGSIDRDQQALLKALAPFLGTAHIQKLERAMRAAKLARFASAALGQGGLSSLLGR